MQWKLLLYGSYFYCLFNKSKSHSHTHTHKHTHTLSLSLSIYIYIYIYYTNIFMTHYNLTYNHCNYCPPYTFTNQILTNSLQLAAMIICPTGNETNVYTFVTQSCYNQRFKFLAWLNLKTRIHTHIHTHTYNHTRNLNGFLSVFCRIFDFQINSIFLTAWWMSL